MIRRHARSGRVVWIGLRPARRAPMQAVDVADLDADGLRGDRGRAGKRAVTLIQAEHLPAIGAYFGSGPVAPEILRRNIVVAGLNLAGMKGRRVRIGGAVLEWTTICAPCSRMEEALGHGGYAAMRGHGGWCARVITPGAVRLGDGAMPLDETTGD